MRQLLNSVVTCHINPYSSIRAVSTGCQRYGSFEAYGKQKLTAEERFEYRHPLQSRCLHTTKAADTPLLGKRCRPATANGLKDADVVLPKGGAGSLHTYTGTIERALAWSGNVIQPEKAKVDVVVIGGGQAGLSVGFNLAKQGFNYVILDSNQHAGGAWQHRWQGCSLFSTRKWSSLPGLPMTSFGGSEHGYPSTQEMASYLAQYELIHDLSVLRPVLVSNTTRAAGGGKVLVDCTINHGRVTAYAMSFEAKAVVSAAGTHSAPYTPIVPGMGDFTGVQMHSSDFRGRFGGHGLEGKRVMVVGGGNSGAQVMAEVAHVAAEAIWCTNHEPAFLPEHIAGRDIFDTVAAIRKGRNGRPLNPEDIPSLSKVVQVDPVRLAKAKGVFENHRLSFSSMTPTGVQWADGSKMDVDVIIWATGFSSNTGHVQGMMVPRCLRGEFAVTPGTHQMVSQPGVFAVGYGNWTGVGSGSIPGAAHYAKRTVEAVSEYCRGGHYPNLRPRAPVFRVPSGGMGLRNSAAAAAFIRPDGPPSPARVAQVA